MNLKGLLAERSALRYLSQRGLCLVTKNYRCRAGEIDLIMTHDHLLIFIEVRARSSDHFGGAAASVTPDKQRKIQRTAEHFLYTHPALSDSVCRFDVVAVKGTRISWLQGAFEC